MVNPELKSAGSLIPKRPIIGRAPLIEAFKADLSQPADTGSPIASKVINHVGEGGIGKSRLFSAMVKAAREIEEQPRPWLAHVNFAIEVYNSEADLMLALRTKLAQGGGLMFPLFDYAFLAWHGHNSPGSDVKGKYAEMLRAGESDVAQDALEWIGSLSAELVNDTIKSLPGWNILYKYAHRTYNFAADHVKMLRMKETVAEFQQIAKDGRDADFVAALKVALAHDLRLAMEKDPSRRVVFMIDSYDTLMDEKTGWQREFSDDWIKTLVLEVPGAHTHIFGREKVAWKDEPRARWSDLIEYRELKGLDRSAAKHLLADRGVTQIEQIDRLVATSTNPFYLHLAADIHESYRRRGEQPPIEVFAGAQEDLVDHYLRHLSVKEREQVMFAAFAHDLTEELYNKLSRPYLSSALGVSWSKLVDRSFFDKTAHGYRMQSMMSLELMGRVERDQPTLFKEIKGAFFDYYVGLFPDHEPEEEDLRLIELASWHGIYHDFAKTENWLIKLGSRALIDGNWTSAMEAQLEAISRVRRDAGHSERKEVSMMRERLADQIKYQRIQSHQMHKMMTLTPEEAAAHPRAEMLDEAYFKMSPFSTNQEANASVKTGWVGYAKTAFAKKSRECLTFHEGGRVEVLSYCDYETIATAVATASVCRLAGDYNSWGYYLQLAERLQSEVWGVDSEKILVPGLFMEKAIFVAQGQSKDFVGDAAREEAERLFALADEPGVGFKMGGFGMLPLAAARTENLHLIERHDDAFYVMEKYFEEDVPIYNPTNRELGYGYFYRANALALAKGNDLGVADFEKALDYWSRPFDPARPHLGVAMDPTDPMFAQAEQTLAWARDCLAENELEPTDTGAPAP